MLISFNARNHLVALFVLLFSSSEIGAQTKIQVSTGSLEVIETFESTFIEDRTVLVWLPNGYSDKTKYAVLYMHDGQMLFDATTTWNGQEWGVDEVAGELIAKGATRPFIVVSAFNGGEQLRYPEYLPQKPWESLTKEQQYELLNVTPETFELDNFVQSDNYLKFLVDELKPYIDSRYSVHTDRDNTFVAGSSMGGLISMYAIGEYPQIFGAAACISTHWPGSAKQGWASITDKLMDYLSETIPGPEAHRIYFDYGDQTLDALYPPMQQEADKVMISKGFDESNWITFYDKGAAHDEKSWRNRLDKPLVFLLGE